MLSPLWAPLPGSSRKRLRGGWRQRARAADAEELDVDAAPEMSNLAAGRLLSWADGQLSATAVRACMQDAVDDGMTHPMVVRIASAGGAGVARAQHSNNGLITLLGECGVLTCLTPIPPPSKVSTVLLPSTIINIMCTYYPLAFKRHFGAVERSVGSFWRQFFERPPCREWAASHPALAGKSPADLTRAIPLTLHEDAGPITKSLSTDCISFGPLLGDGSENMLKYLCFSYVKVRGAGPPTEAWDVIIADFEALITGFVGGSAVAVNGDGDPWSFVLLFYKGDEDVHCNEWGLPHWAHAVEVCSECLANRTNRPYTDLRGCAEWRGTEQMPKEHYLARARVPLHPLLASRFFTRWSCFPDLMHMMDCKGVAAYVCGGILSFLLTDARLGPNKEIRLDLVNTLLAGWYDAHPGTHRLPPLALSHTTSDGWADMCGPAIKAANTRASVPAFKDIWSRYAVPGDERHGNVTDVITSLTEFYNILYGAPMFMPAETISRLKDVCVKFGGAYQRCRQDARHNGVLAWPVKVKTHKMQHVPMLCSVINPVFVQCYAEESQIGTTTKVWKGSVAGRYKAVVQRNVLAKRFTALLLRLEGYVPH